MYRCPKCKELMILNNRTWKCSNNHCYDVAKEGYVNLLLTNSKNHGDNKEMVIARRRFLENDYYKPMAEKLISCIKKINHDLIIDLGCGEGYYTSMIKDACQAQVYGNDVSKEAIRLASKTNKAIHYFIASTADLPIPDHSFDVATCIFSFVDFNEIHRILKQNGILFIVMPAKLHLYELKEKVYDTPYYNEEQIPTSPLFDLVETINVHYEFIIHDTESIKELFTMTPYYFKTSQKDKEKLNSLNELTLHASFLILKYHSK